MPTSKDLIRIGLEPTRGQAVPPQMSVPFWVSDLRPVSESCLVRIESSSCWPDIAGVADVGQIGSVSFEPDIHANNIQDLLEWCMSSSSRSLHRASHSWIGCQQTYMTMSFNSPDSSEPLVLCLIVEAEFVQSQRQQFRNDNDVAWAGLPFPLEHAKFYVGAVGRRLEELPAIVAWRWERWLDDGCVENEIEFVYQASDERQFIPDGTNLSAEFVLAAGGKDQTVTLTVESAAAHVTTESGTTLVRLRTVPHYPDRPDQNLRVAYGSGIGPRLLWVSSDH